MRVPAAVTACTVQSSALGNSGRYTERKREMIEESNMTHSDVKPPPLFKHTRTQRWCLETLRQWYNSFCLVRLWKYKGYCTAKLFTLTPSCTQSTQWEVFWSDNWLSEGICVNQKLSQSRMLSEVSKLVYRDLYLWGMTNCLFGIKTGKVSFCKAKYRWLYKLPKDIRRQTICST